MNLSSFFLEKDGSVMTEPNKVQIIWQDLATRIKVQCMFMWQCIYEDYFAEVLYDYALEVINMNSQSLIIKKKKMNHS